VLVFEPSECDPKNIRGIKSNVNRYFSQYGEHSNKSKYWISFDADSIDSSQFKSASEIMPETSGLSLEFILKLFEVYTRQSIGMDFSEINFSLTQGDARLNDEQTFREIFEFICHQVNQPVKFDDFQI
jgi:arginase family enzyme